MKIAILPAWSSSLGNRVPQCIIGNDINWKTLGIWTIYSQSTSHTTDLSIFIILFYFSSRYQ